MEPGTLLADLKIIANRLLPMAIVIIYVTNRGIRSMLKAWRENVLEEVVH